jgi:cytochrome c biogenesis protein CcmG, thiol:disulfide interchange protein DsbE
MDATKHNRLRRLALLSIVLGAGVIGLVVTAVRKDDSGPREFAGPGEEITLSDNPAPFSSVEFVTFEGETVRLADYVGRPVVLNFWASWCPACIAEMPDLEAVHQTFGDDVVFLGVTVSDRRSDSERFAAETGVTYDLAEDDSGDFYRAYDGIAMPTTVFLTASGELSERFSGVLTEGALTGRLDDLLDQAGLSRSEEGEGT